MARSSRATEAVRRECTAWRSAAVRRRLGQGLPRARSRADRSAGREGQAAGRRDRAAARRQRAQAEENTRLRASSTRRARALAEAEGTGAELVALREERELIRSPRRRHARSRSKSLEPLTGRRSGRRSGSTADRTNLNLTEPDDMDPADETRRVPRHPRRDPRAAVSDPERASTRQYVAELAAYVDEKMRLAAASPPPATR